jgi:hypothetical protein
VPHRRVAYAGITDAGCERLAEAAVAHAANLRAVFAGFSATDHTTLDALLDRLHAVS